MKTIQYCFAFFLLGAQLGAMDDQTHDHLFLKLPPYSTVTSQIQAIFAQGEPFEAQARAVQKKVGRYMAQRSECVRIQTAIRYEKEEEQDVVIALAMLVGALPADDNKETELP